MSQKKSEQNILGKYKISKTLGAGSYGTVVEAKRLSDKLKVAIKTSTTVKKSTEGKMLDLLHYDFILGKLESFSSTKTVNGTKRFTEILVLEYFPSDLATYADEVLLKSHLKIDQIKLIMWQILKGVSYMHSKNIAHCDLKPGNILVDEKLGVKICDLGLAKKLSPSRKKSLAILTRGYRAPEILIGYKYYDKSIDIWSVGAIMTELCTGIGLTRNAKTSFEELRWTFGFCGPFSLAFLNKVARKQKTTEVMKQPKCYRALRKYLSVYIKDVNAIDLIDSMLKMDPNKRATANQALSNRFFVVLYD